MITKPFRTEINETLQPYYNTDKYISVKNRLRRM